MAAVAAVVAVAGAFGVRAALRRLRKTVAVMDATGPVGSAVVAALAKDGRFRVRAVITDPSKFHEKVKGAGEVVTANVHNAFSVNQALLGSDFAFLIPADEDDSARFDALAKKMAEAAKAAHLEHMVWYCMDAPDALNGAGKSGIPRLEGEVSAARYARQIEMPVTFLTGGLPFELLLENASRAIDGRMHLVNLPLGAVEVPAIASQDIGNAAAAIFSASSEKLARKTIPLAAETRTMKAYCDTLSKASKKHFVYNEVGTEVFRKLPGHEWAAALCSTICTHNPAFKAARVSPEETAKELQLRRPLITLEAWAGQHIKADDPRWAQNF